jgi:hypothetical protein
MDPATLYVLVHCIDMVCRPVAPYFSITHSECLRAQSERGADYRCYSQWHDQIVPGDSYGHPAEPDRMDIIHWPAER